MVFRYDLSRTFRDLSFSFREQQSQQSCFRELSRGIPWKQMYNCQGHRKHPERYLFRKKVPFWTWTDFFRSGPEILVLMYPGCFVSKVVGFCWSHIVLQCSFKSLLLLVRLEASSRVSAFILYDFLQTQRSWVVALIFQKFSSGKG